MAGTSVAGAHCPLTIFIIITLSFLMVRFMPGDPLIHLVGEENYYYMKEFNPQGWSAWRRSTPCPARWVSSMATT